MSSTAQAPYSERQSIPETSLIREFIAVIFYILGLSAFIFLLMSVNNNPDIVGPDVLTMGDRVWNFLSSLGIVRPVLLIIAGVMSVRLGLRVRTGYIGAARWARVVLVWLIVLVGAGIFREASQSLNAENITGEPTGPEFLMAMAPWGGVALLLFGTLLLTSRNLHLFGGEEDVTAQRTRWAWNLLGPTLITFLLIGIGPLEQVFITSLTNQGFATNEEFEFVGLDNYTRLLGIRLDSVPCAPEITDSCRVGNAEDGYESVRRYLTNAIGNYRSLGYEPLYEFSLFGTDYALSARDPEFIEATVVSLVYSIVAIALQVVIGLALAMLLTAQLRGMGFLRVALLIPLAIPTLIATQFWDVMLTPNSTGVANSFLLSLGLIDEPQRWLLEPSLQLPSLILVIVWKETPSMALLLLPGLLSISPEIYQAASVDGANRWQKFFRITLPMMRPTIGVALVLRTMVMMRVFDVFEILVGERRYSMATYAYYTLTNRQQLGYSAAISVAIFVVILIFTVIYMRSLRIDEAN